MINKEFTSYGATTVPLKSHERKWTKLVVPLAALLVVMAFTAVFFASQPDSVSFVEKSEILGVSSKTSSCSVQLGGGNDGYATNLQACTGECDADSQCGFGLTCFQRDNGESIPGCTGSGSAGDWDYCYSPGCFDCSPVQLGGGNDGYATNLQACTGECDADSQCGFGLACFQRDNGESIPGCTGSGSAGDWDYCYNPSCEVRGIPQCSRRRDLQANDDFADEMRRALKGESKAAYSKKHVSVPGPLNCDDENRGHLSGDNDGYATDLEACTGECDDDSQCANGLFCFQRDNGEPIPGCTGEGSGGDWDYCFDAGCKCEGSELQGGNDGYATDLRACFGECDADSQCGVGLLCFQRDNGETIPGCTGAGSGGDWDYCYDPECTCTNEIELSGGNDNYATNLQACTGECDQDSQCAGDLRCRQRDNGENIPGCTGDGAGGDWDYCYYPHCDSPSGAFYPSMSSTEPSSPCPTETTELDTVLAALGLDGLIAMTDTLTEKSFECLESGVSDMSGLALKLLEEIISEFGCGRRILSSADTHIYSMNVPSDMEKLARRRRSRRSLWGGGPIANAFEDAGNAIVNVAEDVGNGIVDVANDVAAVAEDIGDFITEDVGGAFEDLGMFIAEDVVAGLEDIADGIADVAAAAVDGLVDLAEAVAEGILVVGEFLVEIAEAVWSCIEGIVTVDWDNLIQNAISGVISSVSQPVYCLANAIKSGFEALFAVNDPSISLHLGFEICFIHCFALEIGIAVIIEELLGYTSTQHPGDEALVFWGYCGGGSFDVGGNVYIGFGLWPNVDNIPGDSYASGVGGDVNVLGIEVGIGFTVVNAVDFSGFLGVIVTASVGVGVNPVSAALMSTCYAAWLGAL